MRDDQFKSESKIKSQLDRLKFISSAQQEQLEQDEMEKVT